tara:strand:+ start:966 stop:1340 length:375 start_codon:yes stop_codon:yes gene_type:complete
MEENIVYSLVEKENNDYSLDFDKLYDEYKIVDQDAIVDEYFAHTINYSSNYNINDLKKIIEFYNSYNNNAIKLIKKKKSDIIDAIVTYELDVNNGPIVNKRKKLWFYIKEIKADKYLSKYIIFN